MSLTIARILHAGYLFTCEETQIAFDPIFENPFSRNCHAFPAVRFEQEQIRDLKLAAVFISHYHDDHCSFDSLDLLDRATPIYIYCLYEELFAMVRELGFVNVQPLQVNVAVQVGPFEVVPREALDAEVDSMFQITAAGLNVLNVVDAWMDPRTLTELAHYAPWDMVLWPYQTMREIEVLSPSRATAAPAALPEDWIAHLTVLNPRYVVPSSCQFEQEPWSWYNHAFFPITYAQFQREIEAALPAAQVLRLNPSVAVTLDRAALRPAAPLAWVVPVGAQDVDYRYDAQAPVPHTADIARHFAPLTAAQNDIVIAYCQAGLLDKYRQMELAPDSYFEQPRVWRLSLYDHAGAVTRFHYRVQGDDIAELDQGDSALSWSTEVPIAKLYAALELGEAMSSMYLRVNDQLFDAGTEQQLQTAEVVDDPLIRCLFNDVFGAYQAAQLRRLQAAQAGRP